MQAMSDEEWALIEPLLPPPCERGRPRETAMHDVVNARLGPVSAAFTRDGSIVPVVMSIAGG